MQINDGAHVWKWKPHGPVLVSGYSAAVKSGGRGCRGVVLCLGFFVWFVFWQVFLVLWLDDGFFVWLGFVV